MAARMRGKAERQPQAANCFDEGRLSLQIAHITDKKNFILIKNLLN
jgi:hypothetical protein